MNRCVSIRLFLGLLVTALVTQSPTADAAQGTTKADTRAKAQENQEAPPKDRVVAMYFHRTQRCPTCLKMGSYAEEAIGTGFAKQVKARTVEFHYIDYQNKKNAAFTRAYKITGPALIVARVTGGKVVEFRDLKDIWKNVNDKKAFFKYVQESVRACQEKNGARVPVDARAGS